MEKYLNFLTDRLVDFRAWLIMDYWNCGDFYLSLRLMLLVAFNKLSRGSIIVYALLLFVIKHLKNVRLNERTLDIFDLNVA